MPRQNRVIPTQDIVATPERGLFMGNRGCLHGADGTLGRARWRSKAWIVCQTAFRDRRRQIMAPGRYTELFFLDEAVALAAGHRPCFECRRAEAVAFRDLWRRAVGPVQRVGDLDAALHAARLTPSGRQARLSADIRDLPDGAFILIDGRPHLVRAGLVHAFSPAGYGPARRPPRWPVSVLTPRPTLRVLRAGYTPVLAPLAGHVGA